jgi:hypothetical protein
MFSKERNRGHAVINRSKWITQRKGSSAIGVFVKVALVKEVTGTVQRSHRRGHCY